MVRLAGLAVIGAGLAQGALGAPSPSSLGSSLTLIFQNDLNWTEYSQHQSAILLSSPVNRSIASSACAALNETLLPATSPYFTADFTRSLAYLSYTGQHPFLQRYWVASAGEGDACTAVGPFGTLLAADCSEQLPVLCGQSAGWAITGNGTNPQAWDLNPPWNSAWEVGVQSGNLSFTGTRDQLSFRFLGIPYANPPARFEYSTVYTGAPQINATAFQSQCTQTGSFSNGSEHCLFLNIYTPYLPSSTPSPSSLKPVLFWVHGGGFTGGMGSDPTFDGGALASRGDTVVVTANYRLSTLGFLALPDGRTNGSFGLADQVTALRWVRQHIAAFGGDPGRVTISGQSAGAASIRVLLASPPAIGLFQAAILQSDPVGTGSSAPSTVYSTIQQESDSVTSKIVALTGCNGTTDVGQQLACLKAYDPLKLVELSTVASSPVVDGTYVTTDQLPLTGSGPLANVHVMIGNMRDDGAALIGYPQAGESLLDAVVAVTGYSNTSIQSLLNTGLFPEPTGPNSTLNVFTVTARIGTDTIFRCLSQATAASALDHSLFKSVWYYQFERSYQLNWWDPNAPSCTPPVTAEYPYGDPSQEYFHCHSGDLYLVFGSLARAALPYRDANDLPFAQRILDRWASFIQIYNPNPSASYLAVRGYTNTYDALVREGMWMPVGLGSEGKEVRVLSVPESVRGWMEGEQCAALNLSLSYFG